MRSYFANLLGSDRPRDEVRLLPLARLVNFPEVLVLPHCVQDLAGELDDPGVVLCPLPGHVHQPVHPTALVQRPLFEEKISDFVFFF